MYVSPCNLSKPVALVRLVSNEGHGTTAAFMDGGRWLRTWPTSAAWAEGSDLFFLACLSRLYTSSPTAHIRMPGYLSALLAAGGLALFGTAQAASQANLSQRVFSSADQHHTLASSVIADVHTTFRHPSVPGYGLRIREIVGGWCEPKAKYVSRSARPGVMVGTGAD